MKIAKGVVDANLAVCAQIDSKIRSFYRWQGNLEDSEEIRIWVKFLDNRSDELDQWISHNHPYDTPQWVVVDACHVSKPYMDWAQGDQ